MATKNRQILLASRPNGEPTPDNFRFVESEVPRPGPGQMLLRSIYLSLDPYMRGRMNAGKSYARARRDRAGHGRASGGRSRRVECARLSGGRHRLCSYGMAGVCHFRRPRRRKLDPALRPLSYGLGILGMPGMTAYTGLLNIGQPQAG